MANYKKKVLKNGLRIITVPMKDNPTVTVLVLVEAGSKYENKENNGISHFLEHMCFKGTENRPNPGDISRELDGLGARHNAFTSHEFTGYYAKAHIKNVDKVLDLVSDLYLNPIFNEKEIEKEKGVIIEEINMYKDLPMRDVQEMFMELLYGDQPAGRSIAGPKENIQKINRSFFHNYRDEHYVASATTVVVVGGFENGKVVKDIEKKFANINSGKHHKKEEVKEVQNAPKASFKNKESDQTHLVVGVRSFDVFSKDAFILSVLGNVLGGGMSSRLFTKLRDDMGICYYVRVENEAFTDHGFFSVSAGVDNKRVGEAVKAILEEMRRLKGELVSPEELKKVKDYITGNMFLSLESTDSIAEFYGIQEILKEPILTAEEIVKKVRAVTSEDIKRVANKIFKTEKLNLALIGPSKDENEKKLLSLLKI